MDISPLSINLEEYTKDENVRERHKKNEDFLRLAISNVEMSKKLGLREGLTYVCTDRWFFGIMLPNNEEIFHKRCRYEFPEPRVVIASHHVFLKNGWLSEPADLDKVVEETGRAYGPLTRSLHSGRIRSVFARNFYSKKIFECDKERTTVRPIYLPVRIEL